MVDMKDYFAMMGMESFITTEVLNNENTSVVEKDGSVIVTCTTDLENVFVEEGVVSCVETYTIDVETREMTSVKTVYTYEDGTVEEGVVTITRDVEAPEGVNPFLDYAQETENMRTVTIISNPGTENEKTDSIQVPKGLQVSVSPDFSVEETMNLYADAACTQMFDAAWDVNTDLTIYVKWGE
jgi:hypothetical protein